jgi:hypothetical protein
MALRSQIASAARWGIDGGSYGGQWTEADHADDAVQAAISTPGVSNLIGFNCRSHYHYYLVVAFGESPTSGTFFYEEIAVDLQVMKCLLRA